MCSVNITGRPALFLKGNRGAVDVRERAGGRTLGEEREGNFSWDAVLYERGLGRLNR